jgi:sugar lactone lactonase YvrE
MRVWAYALLAFAHAAKYLLVTTPENSPEKVWYMVLPSVGDSTTASAGHALTTGDAASAETAATIDAAVADSAPTMNAGMTGLLKDVDGLAKPIGIAVDHARNGLYAADYANGKIMRWTLTEDTALQTLSVTSKATEIYSGGYVSWVAVDSIGNVFFSDEDTSTIWKVSAEELIKSDSTEKSVFGQGILAFSLNCPGVYTDGKPTPVKVYSRDGDHPTSEVSGPGGLAVDNFHVFWGNKQLGTQVGSVVKGYETSQPDKVKQPVKIALNTERVYGICIAGNNVYFTDKRTNIYGVKKHGGGIATISESMKGPRGCAWDGDGTIYVADMEGGKVKSFPANMLNLAPQKLKDVVVDVMQPMSLAVYETPVSRCAESGALRVASAALVLVFALQ